MDRWRKRRGCISANTYAYGQTGREKDKGVGKEDTREGFITRDLLLLPGGGGPASVHTRGVFIRYVPVRARARAYVCMKYR